MRIKFLSVFAAAALLAACETVPDTGAGSTGAGASQTAASSSASPTPGTQEDFVVNVGDRVFFDFDKSSLRAEARTTLERQAFWLRRFPGIAVTIEGYTDERGTREYNLALGERRANSVRDYLVSLGIDAGRIATISYGKERPVNPASTEAAWAENRRGVTVIN